MKFLGNVLTTGLVVLAVPSFASASLIGDTIDVTWLFPDAGTIFAMDSHLVSPAIEIDCPDVGSGSSDICSGFLSAPASIDIGDSVIRYEQVDSPGFASESFNGWVFSDLDWVGTPGEIIGVSLLTNIAGLDLTRVSFTADSVSINLQGLGGDEELEFAELILEVSHGDVPVPGTFLLLALGLFGLPIARRRV